jgi:hypothetical protein
VRVISVGAELAEVTTEAVNVDSGSKVEDLQWSPKGQMLAATTSAGNIHCFLGVIPMVAASFNGQVVHMTSLTECTIQDCTHPGAQKLQIPMLATPHCLALTSSHVIASLNNCIQCYDLVAPMEPPQTREYAGGAVEAVTASDTHVAVLLDGRVVAHTIGSASERFVPYCEQDATAFVLTQHFLILATAKGQLQHYAVGNSALEPLNEYRHSRDGAALAVEQLWAPHGGVHMLFRDSGGATFLFSPVNDQVLPAYPCPCLSAATPDTCTVCPLINSDCAHRTGLPSPSFGMHASRGDICAPGATGAGL